MNELFRKPHLRTNILTGEEVLVSPHRSKRPWQGKEEEKSDTIENAYDSTCYLCPQNTRASKDINPDYKDTFVFDNDFAAITQDVALEKYTSGVLKASAEKGICRVVCFSPNHSLTLSKMKISEIKKVVLTWKNQYEDLKQRKDINNIQIFENRGDIMGCSNPHPHGQIWAQYSIPKEIKRKTKRFATYFKKHNESLLEAYLEQELEDDKRVIYQNEHFVVVVPFWATWPFETMIIPKKRASDILSLTEKKSLSFAEAIQKVTTTYDAVFDVPFPYSSGIHQAPSNGKKNLGWHWHMSFYPPLLRSATVKKFMVGYELFATPQRDVTAEKAAEILKTLISS